MAVNISNIPDSLKTSLKNGRVIPFIGSGISRSIERKTIEGGKSFHPLFPNWKEFVEILAKKLIEVNKNEEAVYVKSRLELSPPKYLEAMQVAFDELGEDTWYELLDNTFDIQKKEAEEKSLQLSCLIWQLGSNLIITTNIDRVLKWCCPRPEEFRLLDVQKKELGKLHKEVAPKCPTVIYLHGHIDDKANIIFTKDQYRSFYDYKINEAKLETLKTLLTRRTFLFLGFSLDDPYFLRQIEYFHKLYEGGADSLFVVLHKSEKDNSNIPDYVKKIFFEDFGAPLLDLLKQMADISQPINEISIKNPASTTLPKPIDVSEKELSDIPERNVFRIPPPSRTESKIKVNLQKYRSYLVLFITLFVGTTLFFWLYQENPIENIAILPFGNETGSEEFNFLPFAVQDGLVTSLSNLSQIKVRPSNSVNPYGNTELDFSKISRELNVEAILVGKIRSEGNYLTVHVELIEIKRKFWVFSTATVILSNDYRCEKTEYATLQTQIASDLPKKLKLKLSDAEAQKVGKSYTNNTEAYKLYAEGREFWNKRNTENLEKAKEKFKQATKEDQNYALAYVGLADCYNLQEQYAGTPLESTLQLAIDNVKKALDIDDSLAEAHASLGVINRNMWIWSKGREEHELAVHLNPNYPTARHWYATCLLEMGEYKEAYTQISAAHELAPESAIIANTADIADYMLNGDTNSAIKRAVATADRYPEFPGAHTWLGFLYSKQQGNYDLAIKESEKGFSLSPSNPSAIGNLGYVYAVANKPQEAANILKSLEEKYDKKEALGFHIAMVYIGLNDIDNAFECLRRDFRNHSGVLRQITWSPPFEALRNDKRYFKLLQDMKLRQ